MTATSRHVIAAAYAGVSGTAAILQHALGHLNPPLLAFLIALTALSIRATPHRWTTLLILTHVLIVAVAPSVDGIPALATLAALAVSLGALHLLAPWLSWRPFHLTADRHTLTLAVRPLASMAAFALATAVLVNALG
ncbi:MAG: hypothetical protein IPN45_06850 [Actinomycetales bacterium]|nr:hypothetical protein [Actinomycetales bacterium]